MAQGVINKVQAIKVSQINALIDAYKGNDSVISALNTIKNDIHNKLINGCPKCNQSGTLTDDKGNTIECDLCDGQGRSNDTYQINWLRVKSK